MDHLITEKHDKSHSDGNMSTITPVCSCGWAGHEVAAYNDDQLFQARRQSDYHLLQMRIASNAAQAAA